MRTPIALSNLTHSIGRTILSVGGIGIAIVLIFMQLGFLSAVENTATTIYSKMEFDLLVRSPEYLYLAAPRQIPRSVLNDVASCESVEQVVPFHAAMAFWRHPQGVTLRGMVLMGVNPAARTFRDAQVNQHFDRLTSDEALLIDRKTHREYGPANGRRFGEQDIGVVTDLTEKRVQIVGLFEMGSGLTANGAAIVNEQAFDRIDPHDSQNFVSLGLVQLKPNADRNSAVHEIRGALRSDAGEVPYDILTRDQVIARELNRWITETPIGYVFTLGVVISLIVGSAIVYMVLSTDITNRIREYATLKAIGYSNWFLGGVVMRQGALLALVSFIPAMIVSIAFYQTTAWLANLPIFMTWSRLLFVLVLTFVMCLVSALLAIRKLWKADPAELF